MPHNAAFHQDLHCLLKRIELQRKHLHVLLFENRNLWPLDVYIGPSQCLLYQTSRKNSLVYKGYIKVYNYSQYVFFFNSSTSSCLSLLFRFPIIYSIHLRISLGNRYTQCLHPFASIPKPIVILSVRALPVNRKSTDVSGRTIQ